jgi:hypothetical protein
MIEPLKKTHQRTGKPLTRPKEVEAWLSDLHKLEPEARVALLVDGNGADGRQIPPEALVHFTRQAYRQGQSAQFETLFGALFRTVTAFIHAAVPISRNRDVTPLREDIWTRFVTRLSKDCDEGGGRLDFFEVRFACGLACLRISALRTFLRKEGKAIVVSLSPSDDESESRAISLEIEEAVNSCVTKASSLLDDSDFRFWFETAISTLPDNERRAFVLRLQGMPIASKDTDKTISKVLKCTERTVNNLLTRAVSALRKKFQEEKPNGIE